MEGEPKAYDVVFSVDWSNSMNINMTGMGGKNGLTISKEMIKQLSKKLLNENENSRVRLIGYNNKVTAALPINVQIDTGFIDSTSDYEKIIDNAYSVNPIYSQDNIPEYIMDSAKKIENDSRENATPVLIMMSDYDIVASTLELMKSAFYNLNDTLELVGGFSIPVLMNSGRSYQLQMIREMPGIVNQYQGWDWLEVKNTTIEDATIELKNKMGEVYAASFNATLETNRFNFKPESFVSNNEAALVSLEDKKMQFKGLVETESTGSYGIVYDKNKNSNNQLGDMNEVTTKNSVAINGEETEFNEKPSVFLPYTDAAIELYTYDGTGSEADASNYHLSKAIMGSHYNSYGGQTYEYKNANLSGLLYGTELLKSDALSIVKETLKEEFDKWDFGTPTNPTASSQTMTFDAAQNVYKVYGKSKVGTVTIRYQNELFQTIVPDEEFSGSVGDSYDYSEWSYPFDGYKYSHVIGNPIGTITENPQTVTFIYKESQFELVQEVHNMDGEIANEVRPGEKLLYTVTLKSNFSVHTAPPTSPTYYKNLSIIELLDLSLENVEDIQLTLSDGTLIGSGIYDAATNTIKGVVIESAEVFITENIILTYHATVKETTIIGTEIKEKAKADATYTSGMIASEKESNEVISKVIAGELIFESAPNLLDFGNPVKISPKEEVYPIHAKEGNLSVRDLRGKGKQWSMTAKMLELLTSNDGHILTEGLYYQYKGNEQLMGVESSALVYDKTTSSADSIIISDEWVDELNEPIVKVKPGQARKGKYSGVIQWTLQDVPSAFASSDMRMEE